jgi:hypothetical protein
MKGAEEDAVHANPGLWTVVNEPSWGDPPVEEVLPSATLIKDGSRMGMPDTLPEVEPQTAPLPHHADASSMGWTNEEMVREEPPPREAMLVT